MLPVGHKRKRVQTKLFGDDFVREDLRPSKAARRRKVMEPGGPDEAQGADALLSLAALAEQAESDTQSGDEGLLLLCCTLLMTCNLEMNLGCCAASCQWYHVACRPCWEDVCHWLLKRSCNAWHGHLKPICDTCSSTGAKQLL